MPVRFKTDSEYHEKYKWLDSPKSASFQPSQAQAAIRAGLTSPQHSKTEGYMMEPPIQRKKHPIPITTTSTTKMFNDAIQVPDDYILLGNQEKFSANIPYKDVAAKNRGRVLGTTYVKPSVPVMKPADFESSSPPAVKPAPAVHIDTGAPKKREKVPAAPTKNGLLHINTADVNTHDKSQQKANPNMGKTVVLRKSNKLSPERKELNGNAVTSFKSGKENKSSLPKQNVAASDEFVMKYRAGLAPARPGNKRRSEYMMKFDWKKPVYQTPLLAAEQIIHNNNPQLGPYNDKTVKSTEYQKQFQPWKISPVKSVDVQTNQNNNNFNQNNNNNNRNNSREMALRRTKSEMDLTPDQRPAAGSPSKVTHENIRLTESLNPQKPFFPHKRQVTWKSEYKTNFQPFTKFSYDNGAWIGAPPPHIISQMNEEDVVPQESSPSISWFSEVCELRQKAEEYRKRSRGTHFSREHVAQLMAQQSKLWDEISMNSSLSALSLEPAKGDTAALTTSETEKSPSSSHVKTKTKKAKQRNESVQAGAPSSGYLPDHGARRLAWSSDGGRSTSPSDSVRSIRSSSTPSASESAASTLTVQPSVKSENSTENGRVQTPELVASPRTVRRHHLDVTTPARHGALLASPPHKYKTGERLSETVQRALLETAEKKLLSNQKLVKSQRRAGVDRSYSTDSCDCTTSPVKQMLTYPPSQLSPAAGKPTRDTHALLDEDIMKPEDKILETRYVSSPQPSKERAAGLSTLKESGSQTYKVLPKNFLNSEFSRNDDEMSDHSIISVATSVTSLASEVLDRARKRDGFWRK